MSPFERAEKIRAALKLEGFQHFIPVVAAQIEEAEREAVCLAVSRAMVDADKATYEYFCKGFNTAKEKAKEIAKAHESDAPDPCDFVIRQIASGIAEMEPEK